MKVVVVYESMFGNTEAIAHAVRSGLVRSGIEANVVEVGEARSTDLQGVDLLVIGAPTHALTLSRPSSRAEAVERGADPPQVEVGVREWLTTLVETLPASAPRPAVAVFDTRVLKAKCWPGSAARQASRILRKAGFSLVGTRSFYVDGMTGPQAAGEMTRALEWGAALPAVVGLVGLS